MSISAEARIRAEIESWLDEEPGLVSSIGDRLGRPLTGLARRLMPDGLRSALHRAFEQALLRVGDASQFTFTVGSVLEPFHRRGYEVQTLAEIRALPLEVCDTFAGECIRSHRLISALEGGGLGLGGAAMIAADIPALMMINLRMLSQIAHSFGYNTLEGRDRLFLLQILSLASAGAGDGRRQALERLIRTSRQGADDGAMTGKSGQLALVKLAQELGEKLALRLAHRKLGQLVPIIGAGIGAGMNYHFTEENGRAALVAYRSRRLDEGSGHNLLSGPPA